MMAQEPEAANADDTRSSVAAIPAWITPELITDTKSVWQPYYVAELTTEDAIEILVNVSELFTALE